MDSSIVNSPTTELDLSDSGGATNSNAALDTSDKTPAPVNSSPVVSSLAPVSFQDQLQQVWNFCYRLEAQVAVLEAKLSSFAFETSDSIQPSSREGLPPASETTGSSFTASQTSTEHSPALHETEKENSPEVVIAGYNAPQTLHEFLDFAFVEAKRRAQQTQEELAVLQDHLQRAERERDEARSEKEDLSRESETRELYITQTRNNQEDVPTILQFWKEQQATWPLEVQDFVEKLAELWDWAHQLSKETNPQMDMSQMQKLDSHVYSPIPSGGLISRQGHTPPVVWAQIAVIQKEVHHALEKAGFQVIAPQKGEMFHSDLHRYIEGDVMYVTDPTKHNRVDTLLSVGFAVAGAPIPPLRAALVIRCLELS